MKGHPSSTNTETRQWGKMRVVMIKQGTRTLIIWWGSNRVLKVANRGVRWSQGQLTLPPWKITQDGRRERVSGFHEKFLAFWSQVVLLLTVQFVSSHDPNSASWLEETIAVFVVFTACCDSSWWPAPLLMLPVWSRDQVDMWTWQQPIRWYCPFPMQSKGSPMESFQQPNPLHF